MPISYIVCDGKVVFTGICELTTRNALLVEMKLYIIHLDNRMQAFQKFYVNNSQSLRIKALLHILSDQSFSGLREIITSQKVSFWDPLDKSRQSFSLKLFPEQRRFGFQLDGLRLILFSVLVPTPKLSIDSVLKKWKLLFTVAIIIPQFNGPCIVHPGSFQIFSELWELDACQEGFLVAINAHHILGPPCLNVVALRWFSTRGTDTFTHFHKVCHLRAGDAVNTIFVTFVRMAKSISPALVTFTITTILTILSL